MQLPPWAECSYVGASLSSWGMQNTESKEYPYGKSALKILQLSYPAISTAIIVKDLKSSTPYQWEVYQNT